MIFPVQVSREHVLAFRVRRQHLDRRLPAGAPAEAVAVCGIRTTPAGTATAALAAQVAGLGTDTVPAALQDGSLVEVLGPRQVPTLVLPADVTVLTAGAPPAEDTGLRDALGENSAQALTAAGIGLADAVRQVAAAARDELAAGARTRGSLSATLTRRLPAAMSSWCQRCGSTHLHETLFRTAGGAGAFRIQPSPGRETTLAALDGPRPCGTAGTNTPPRPSPTAPIGAPLNRTRPSGWLRVGRRQVGSVIAARHELHRRGAGIVTPHRGCRCVTWAHRVDPAAPRRVLRAALSVSPITACSL